MKLASVVRWSHAVWVVSGDVGPELPQRPQPHRGAHHEDAAVPVVAAVVHIALRGGQIGLLDELGDELCRIRIAAVGAGATQVAEAGFRSGGCDAQRDDGAVRCRPHGPLQRGGEGSFIDIGVVCGGHDEHRIGAIGRGMQGRQRHRRRGVAAHRLQQHGGRWQFQFAQLVEHQETVLLVADDERRRDRDVLGGQRREPLGGLLEQALVALQHQELLRVLGARTAATAACRCHRP